MSTPEAPEAAAYTAADVIDADRWYSPRRIQELLGVLPGKRVRYVPSGRVTIETPARYFRNKTGRGELIGRELLAWLKGEQVQYELTPAAVRLVQRRRQAEQRRSPQPPTSSDPVDRALRHCERLRNEEEQGERREKDQALERYAALLQKGETGEHLTEAELRELTDILVDLEITGEKVAEDRRLIAKARKLQDLHESRETLRVAARDAQAAYHEMRERHKQEEHRCYMEKAKSERDAADASGAASRLLTLAKRRPQFFEDGHPPRLKRVD